MKKVTVLLISLFLVFVITGCSKEAVVKKTVEGSVQTYYEMSDGTWRCNDYIYKNYLKVSGRMPNAAVNSTFVYLSNLEEISFEQAWKAAGLSSSTEDYFFTEDAVLVDIRTE